MAYKGYFPAIMHESLCQEAKDALAAYACNDFRNASWVKEENDDLQNKKMEGAVFNGIKCKTTGKICDPNCEEFGKCEETKKCIEALRKLDQIRKRKNKS